MSNAPQYTLDIVRRDSRPVMMVFKSLVNGDALDVRGSTFTLHLYDALGAELIARDGVIGDDGVVSFTFTLQEKAALPAGRNGRWQVVRAIGGSVETWGSGTASIGGAL